MLRSLRVRDFQSLRDVSLDLGRLTVIIGATNSGKSAVVRALQAALFNWAGGEFVRRDAVEALVTLDGETFQLEWRKPRRGGAQYTLDGSVITRAGRYAPVLVEAATGVREISGEGFRSRPQVDAQFDEPFLLAGTGGQAARLLARVSKLDVLVTAQVLARRDMERTRRAGAEAANQALELADRLAAQPDFEALLERWRTLAERWREVQEARAAVAQAEALIVQARELEAVRHRWGAARLPERLGQVRPAAEALGQADRLLSDAIAAEIKLETARRQKEAAEVQAVQARLDLEKVLAELEVCPICGRPMKGYL